MPHSLLSSNLQLLDSKLQDLFDTTYFDQRVRRYIGSLRQIIRKLTDPGINLDDTIREFIGSQVWSATEFIAGCAPRLQPYEMVYGLHCAIREWFAAQKHGGVRDPLIATSLLQEPNFYFKSVNPTFEKFLQAYLREGIEFEIVQIALPDIYRRKPLYSVALYHELGHFLDTRFSISENVDVITPALTLPGMSAPTSSMTYQETITRLYHLREYFADAFAACYCGSAIKRFLEGFAPNSGPSPTHPATYNRIQVIQAVLTDTPHSLLNLNAFNLALSARAQPQLRKRFSRPPVDSCFDAMRPVPMTSDAEVHGILDAAWAYLDKASERTAEPWLHLSDLEIERTINDLVEKSIRNRMILEQWTDATVESN
jgi:hypothetical protein